MSGDGAKLHRAATRLLSLAIVAIGVALVARTVAAGGGALAYGIVVGVLFIAAGGARLWLAARDDRGRGDQRAGRSGCGTGASGGAGGGRDRRDDTEGGDR